MTLERSSQSLVGLAYQPPTNGTFLSEQTSHHQLANSTALFVWLISRQPTVLFSQNKLATTN
jgi:hypothetical protein